MRNISQEIGISGRLLLEKLAKEELGHTRGGRREGHSLFQRKSFEVKERDGSTPAYITMKGFKILNRIIQR